MKNNSTMIAILIAVVVGAGIMAFFIYRNLNASSLVAENDGKPQITTLLYTEVENNNVEMEEFQDQYANANNVTVEMVIRTIKELEDGSSDVSYGTYLMSDIDIAKKTESTVDYSNCSVGDDFDIEGAISTDFESAYGFDCKGLNGWELYGQLLSEEGIDGELSKVTFDEDTYAMTGQKLYVVEDECTVTKMLLEDEKYDEVIDSQVSFQVSESETGTQIPEYFTASVQYKANNQIITKNMFLQVTINSWK